MRIWITRHTTGSLHSGGLQRCQVWFVKPVFKYYDTRPVHVMIDEVPWGIDPMEGLGRWGWEAGRELSLVKVMQPISFGDLFGYGEGYSDKHPNYVKGLAEHVWGKLLQHYGNSEFPHGWYDHENAGKCRQEDFLLEIDLSVSFDIPKSPIAAD